MCISPVTIPNPYYGFKGKYAFMHDCSSKYIHVPCGKCKECVSVRQLGIVQRILMECEYGYPFFGTLTYSNEELPHMLVNGYNIRYADMSDFSNMVKCLRNDNAFGRPFRYFAVSELGSKGGRPHIHFLLFIKKLEGDNSYTPINLEALLFNTVLKYWRRNYGSNRNPRWRPLCNYVSRYICGKIKSNYDLHYVSPSSLDGTVSDALFYVTKYLLKGSERSVSLQRALKLNLSDHEYNFVWRKIKCRCIKSLNFGFGIYGLQPKKLSLVERLNIISNTPAFSYVRDCVLRSLNTDSPKFYNPDNGRSMPLSRYYKSFGNLFTEQDAIYFHFANPNWREDNMVFDDKDISLKLLSEEQFNKAKNLVDNRLFNFDLLY